MINNKMLKYQQHIIKKSLNFGFKLNFINFISLLTLIYVIKPVVNFETFENYYNI